MAATEFRFRRGDAGADQLQKAVDEIMAELHDPDSEAAARAKNAGLPSEIADAQVTVREEGPGIDPLTAAILVGVGTNLASHVVVRLLEDVVWPLVKRRTLGARAVGDRVE